MEQVWQVIVEHLGDVAMLLSAVMVFFSMNKNDRKKLIKKLAKMRLKGQKQVEKLKATNEKIEELEKETNKNA